MTTLFSHGRTILAATLCTALAACHTTSGTAIHGDDRDHTFCEERPVVCATIGAVVVGGVIALASSSGGSGASTGGETGGNIGDVSDARLKSDMRFVEQLENGINLYAFRYTGDDRVFVGVNAAEIQADPRYAHAVVELGNDFLGVNYQALGLEMINENEMHAASDAAIARAGAS
ncbi:hypothetical protein [Pelagibacterium montanilacus]|uniref:hypothetical protein n=1 Tax=Pelagibacterium montanilacus TaxID=2185280 RepID=UPI000F8C4BBC|nr:hypothetical protein [Pelagibacterium montanilacus]